MSAGFFFWGAQAPRLLSHAPRGTLLSSVQPSARRVFGVAPKTAGEAPTLPGADMSASGDEEGDHEEAVPLFGTWKRAYLAVAVVFVFDVALFYGFSRYFS